MSYARVMRALIFGVEPDPQPKPDTDNRLLRALARTPVKLIEMDDPGFIHPDWVVTKPRLTGICGSESKQIFFDYASYTSKDRGADNTDNAMRDFVLVPAGDGPRGGGRRGRARARGGGPRGRPARGAQPVAVVRPRGIDPHVSRVRGRRLQPVLELRRRATSRPGSTPGCRATCTGGYAELMPAHDSMLFAVPDAISDEQAVFADPFAVSLHGITRHPPPPGGKVLVYGRGRARDVRGRDPARALPRRRGGGRRPVRRAGRARRAARRARGRAAGAPRGAHRGPGRVVRRRAAPTWRADGLPMCHPGGIDVVYDTVGKPETFEVEVRAAQGPRDPGQERRPRARHGGSGARSTSRRSAGSAPTRSASRRSRGSASTASSTTSTSSAPAGSTSRGC